MKRRVAKFTIDSVVVNGDLIEGKQPKQKCSELMLVAPNDQETAAVFLDADLRNWLEKNTGREVPFYFVQGTEYHEGRELKNWSRSQRVLKGQTFSQIPLVVTAKKCLTSPSMEL